MESLEEAPEVQSDLLAGQSIVVSGIFAHHSRDEYKAMIEAHGGKNVGSVSKKTSFILAGENMGPEKRKKAEEQKKNKSLEGKKKLLDNLFSETSEKEGIKTTKFRMFRKSKDGTVKIVNIGGPTISLSGKIAKEMLYYC